MKNRGVTTELSRRAAPLAASTAGGRQTPQKVLRSAEDGCVIFGFLLSMKHDYLKMVYNFRSFTFAAQLRLWCWGVLLNGFALWSQRKGSSVGCEIEPDVWRIHVSPQVKGQHNGGGIKKCCTATDGFRCGTAWKCRSCVIGRSGVSCLTAENRDIVDVAAGE